MAESTKSFTIKELLEFVEEKNVKEYNPNAIKVSSTDNPMYFPVANTYQVGSSEIVAMCSNAVAVGTGQTGDAPLYVFCKDGIYALFVDASGEMTYTNARVIARDVCNNAKSVTPIDDGVVFTTDRGLMMISGEQVVEIGQPLEGDYSKFAVIGNLDYDRVCRNAFRLSQLADLKEESLTQTDFLDFLKDSIVAYNHNERELMICNTKRVSGRLYYDYMYVLDRHGNWTRRDYNAEQFVENYPVTYRVSEGKMYQMDEESDADNGIFALSNVIKLDSIGFKAIDRVVARGLFDTVNNSVPPIVDSIGCEPEGSVEAPSDDGFRIDIIENADQYVFDMVRPGTISLNIERVRLTKDWDAFLNAVLFFEIYDESGNLCDSYNKTLERDGTLTYTLLNVTYTKALPAGRYKTRVYIDGYGRDLDLELSGDNASVQMSIEGVEEEKYVGIYAFGSYDGRTWACLGHNERKGNFTDLGCNVERTDCKFFRFLLAGQITKESRLDYFEVSAKQSRLSTKIR